MNNENANINRSKKEVNSCIYYCPHLQALSLAGELEGDGQVSCVRVRAVGNPHRAPRQAPRWATSKGVEGPVAAPARARTPAATPHHTASLGIL